LTGLGHHHYRPTPDNKHFPDSG